MCHSVPVNCLMSSEHLSSHRQAGAFLLDSITHRRQHMLQQDFMWIFFFKHAQTHVYVYTFMRLSKYGKQNLQQYQRLKIKIHIFKPVWYANVWSLIYFVSQVLLLTTDWPGFQGCFNLMECSLIRFIQNNQIPWNIFSVKHPASH